MNSDEILSELTNALIDGYTISLELVKGCMCGSCHEYVIRFRDEDEYRDETLAEALKKWKQSYA